MKYKYIVVILLLVFTVGIAIVGIQSFKKSSNSRLAPSDSVNNPVTYSEGKIESAGKSAAISKPEIKQYPKFPGVLDKNDLQGKKAVIETKKGVIEFEIYPEASKAASNFIFLAQDNFYDGLTFHRVVPGFVIQGGDPLGDGTGGPGYRFEDEPVTRKYDQGIVAMANAGPDTNGSQFFVILEDNPTLPPAYTIFGKVIKGQNVVEQIQIGDVMEKVFIDALK